MSKQASLTSMVPVLLVDDVRRSQWYYYEYMGFRHSGFDFEGTVENSCQLTRDQCSLLLLRCTQKGAIRPMRELHKGAVDLVIWVENLKELEVEFKAKDAQIISVGDTGVERFLIVEDDSGYHIEFSELHGME